DDFGTGYSSLAYLKRLGFDRLKIDRSFVADLGQDTDGRAIVTAIVRLAQTLGMQTVAEGVETDEQARILASLGCDAIQGWLVARALPADDFMVWLAAHDAAAWRRRWTTQG
ncbi:EAL domain-containing protein, partial [Tepidimonas sp.]|uniref:EAL domain-containing protein n=1 Tax=Tepidimonas sp. TaxID=2002775 RepID=UPI002FE21A3E